MTRENDGNVHHGTRDNVQTCIGCGSDYESGSGGRYTSLAAAFCGLCLISALGRPTATATMLRPDQGEPCPAT